MRNSCNTVLRRGYASGQKIVHFKKAVIVVAVLHDVAVAKQD
jgi:hypothetical protein